MIYLALVSVIWAFSFGLIGSALSGVDSFLVATLRLGVASIIFLPFLRLKGIGSVDRFRLIIYGAIQFGLMYASHAGLPIHPLAFGGDLFHPYSSVCGLDPRPTQTHLFQALSMGRHSLGSWSGQY